MKRSVLRITIALVLALSMVIASVSAVSAGKPILPDGWFTIGSHYYQVIAGDRTWSDANTYANALGYIKGNKQKMGHLVTINSARENRIVAANVPTANGGRAWIGAYQTNNSDEPAGNWVWVTGETWKYTNWGSGEPNDGNGGGHEDWAVIYSNGFWNDTTNTAVYYMVVEYE